MSLFDSPAFENHEAVHFFNDAASGLKAIIAIHSTARGPAAGGCRMFAYPCDQAAIDDALRLSRAMSHKNAVADLDLGGGKAVIIGDPRTVKSGPLFEAFGASVKQLGGRYWSAEDVGVSPADLAHARRKTRYVAGLEGHAAASGDPSPVTAEGVKRGIELCVRRALGRDLSGVRVAIQGVGHVGAYLADKLGAAGARLTITDVDETALQAVAERTGAQIVGPDEIFDVEADVFAPCAMGGAITCQTIDRLQVKVIAGGANNQLGDPEAGAILEARGMLYAPDFVINGGGIINVAGEIRALRLGEAFDPTWVAGKLDRLMETLSEVLDRAVAERRTPHDVAVTIAEARIAAARERA
jgi:leucine dehydrogenase